MNWFFNDQGQAKGPHQEQEMGKLLSAGTITVKTLVWNIKLPAWEELGKLPVNWEGPTAAFLKDLPAERVRTTPVAPSTTPPASEGGGLLKKLFGFGKK